MVHFTQEHRALSMATPLGKDVLLLAAFGGEEALSRLFHYQLTMYSQADDISPSDIVGKNVTWCVQLADMGTRFFNGFIRSFAAGSLGNMLLNLDSSSKISFDRVRRAYRLLDPSGGDTADADGFLRMLRQADHPFSPAARRRPERNSSRSSRLR